MLKLLTTVFFYLAVAASAWQATSEITVVGYEDHGLYVTVTPLYPPQRILVELRRAEDDVLLHSETKYKGITCWLDSVKDVTGDGNEEILLKCSGGGTGVCTEHFDILTVDFESLKLVGAFSCIVNDYAVPMSDCDVIFPDGTKDYMSSIHVLGKGQIRPWPNGILQYFYSEMRREGVDHSICQKLETYRFRTNNCTFELVAE